MGPWHWEKAQPSESLSGSAGSALTDRLGQRSPTFLAQGTGFIVEDNFSMDGGEWFGDDSSALLSLCTLFLI